MKRRRAKGSHGDSCPTLEEYGEGERASPSLDEMKGALGQRWGGEGRIGRSF